MDKNISTILLLLTVLSPAATGWGNETQKYICDKVVSEVWGEQALNQCLKFDKTLQTELCSEIKQTVGEEAYEKCIQETNNGNYIHPATIPYALFNDTAEHCDYSVCPAKGAVNQQLMCGNPLITPAKDNSEKWFNKSMNAENLCARIAFFCIGSNYYSDSRFKLNNVQNLKMCYSNVREEIDREVLSNGIWQFNVYCIFDGWVQRAGRTVREMHSQSFTFSSGDISQIIGNLSEKAKYAPTIPPVNETPIEVTARKPMIEVTEVAVVTSPTTTLPVNETQIMYDEAMEQVKKLVNESFDLVGLLGDNKTGTGQNTKGKGNIFIKAFMILLVVFGFGFAMLVLAKIELKRYQQSKASEPKPVEKSKGNVSQKP